MHERLRSITSRQNATLKQLRRAFTQSERTPEGDCAVEGVRILEEAIRAGLRFRTVVFSETGAAHAAARLLPQIGAQVETLVVPDDVFNATVATESPQGVAALVRVKQFQLDDVLRAAAPLIVVAAGLQDPGNLGTIIRSAEAFGAAGLLLAENTVSPFNAKAVRASAGSVFRLPTVEVTAHAAIETLRARGLCLLATSSHKGTPVHEAQLTGGVALFIGNEGAGLPREVLRAINETVVVPHSEKVESLNAGVAASVILYEAARQRKT